MIRSRSNPLIKQARSLRERKVRQETGLFLVEGIHHVGEAVAAGWNVEAILYAPEILRSGFAIDLLSGYQGRQEQVSGEVMSYLATKDNPSGIVAIVHQRLPGLGELGRIRRCVAIVSPQDPGNVGTILRTMDACGCDALILLDGGVDAYHPTAIRAALGATFWKPFVKASFDELLSWSRPGEIYLIGTSARGAQDYRGWQAREPWVLVLGSEQKGLTTDQLQACEVVVSLPMQGRATSLNLAVAAGVLLYHLTAAAPGRAAKEQS